MTRKKPTMYCPKCKTDKVCRAVSTSSQLQRIPQHEDICWFRRKRQCEQGHYFVTAEIHEKVLHELAELRKKYEIMRKEVRKLHNEVQIKTETEILYELADLRAEIKVRRRDNESLEQLIDEKEDEISLLKEKIDDLNHEADSLLVAGADIRDLI